jgi:exodeoxyribonuclease VII large subunit
MNEKLSLSELQLIIRDSLYLSLPRTFWVTAEISEISVNSSGHCYLELIEKNPDEKNIRARIRGIIWSSRYGFIKSFFENITGETLRGGLKILVRAKVEYHELYGLSIVINDIDPAFTLGELAIKRQLIIRQLEQEGVFSMNRELNFPVCPQRIAVISSKAAAGYRDFINHLRGNSFGYVFYTALIETPMQGTDTEEGVTGALDRVAMNAHLFDLVVIIRGGGSQTDLSWFDNYNIAYHVTQFPLPVVTGIGHEKDMSVTDMVASRSLKTPTAVADFLIDCMASAEERLLELSTGIRDLSGIIVAEGMSLTESFRIKLLPVARLMISENREKLSAVVMELVRRGREETFKAGVLSAGQLSRLVSSVKSFSSGRAGDMERSGKNLVAYTMNSLANRNSRLLALENALTILDPENVLRRGYTITSLNGKILKKRDQVKKDDLIKTRFSDGSVSSKVTD